MPELPDAPDPTSTKGIQVTVTDLDTGQSDTKVIWDDYVLICAGSCYRHAVQSIGVTGETHILTVKGRRNA